MKTDLSFGSITIPVSDQVRVSTLNVLNNKENLQERIEFFCEELNQIQPDILLLQEVIFEVDKSYSLDFIAANTSLKNIHALPQFVNSREIKFGIAIASSMETIKNGTFHLDHNHLSVTNKNAIYSVFKHASGKVVIAITAHLHWGGEQEFGRIIQLSAINRKAKELYEEYKDFDPIIVLGGDFNAVPEGDAMRFMTGKGVGLANDGAYWVDAWDILGDKDNEYTSLPLNYWHKKTALNNGILIPELLPSRRIDYLLGYGWCYGKHGSPLTFQQSFISDAPQGYPISDHNGLTVDYWIRQV